MTGLLHSTVLSNWGGTWILYPSLHIKLTYCLSGPGFEPVTADPLVLYLLLSNRAPKFVVLWRFWKYTLHNRKSVSCMTTKRHKQYNTHRLFSVRLCTRWLSFMSERFVSVKCDCCCSSIIYGFAERPVRTLSFLLNLMITQKCVDWKVTTIWSF